MYQIQQITSDSFQKQKLILADGSVVGFTIQFKPMQLGWFVTELTYGNFILRGMRITNNPNLLYQWRNVLPFGLACFSTDDREPSQSQDFSSLASIMYILSAAEVAHYSDVLSGKI